MKKKHVDKNKIDFCSIDPEVLLLLNELKQQKQYQSLSSALSLIGNFDGEIELNLYDTISKDDYNKIVLCFFDLDDNLFTICPVSTDKKDLLKFTKEDNNGQMQYDLSLAKKFKLTEDNIQLTRTSHIFNTKFGRFITDNETFYSLFLGDNTAYQIEIDCINDDYSLSVESLVNGINSLDAVPKLQEFVTLFDIQMRKNKCKFNRIKITAFKDFEIIGNIIIDSTEQKDKIKKL